MEGGGERSELLRGLDTAHELALAAAKLPAGWAIELEPTGQLTIVPPPSMPRADATE